MQTPPRWTLGSRSTVALVLALLVLVVVGIAALWQFQSYRRATMGVRESLRTLNAIENVTRRLVDAETAQRGFLLTGRPAYLEPLTTARATLPAEIDDLAKLTRADAVQHTYVATLQPLVARKLDELARTIELRRSGGFEAALAAVETDAGKQVMDTIRETLAAMTRAENAELATRQRTTEARNGRVLLALALAGTLGCLLVAGCAVGLNAESRRRLAAQAALAESEERLRVTLRSIGDAVIATDSDGRVVFMNPVAELLTGWTTPDAHGRPLAEIFVIANETTRAPVENPVARVLREGITVGLANHTVLFARDGREIPIDDSAAPIRDATRVIMGVVLVFRDVTERRQFELEAAHAARLEAERAESERGAALLRASEERYRSLVAASMDIVWTAGPTGTFEEPQPAWEAYTGQRWPQDAGQGWALAVHPDDREPVIKVWEAAQLARSTLEVEGRVWHALSGEYHHCHGRGVPLLDAEGKIRQWVGMIEDVHERRRHELENARLLRVAEDARRQAETSSRAKDEFLAVLSHELRSPLQTMLTWVRLLRDAAGDDPTTAHGFDALTQSMRTQQGLIDDLLDVSRIVSGTLTLERAPFDLTATANACLDRIAPHAIAQGLTVERDGLDRPRPVLGDAARFAQALGNVLQNAVKFTPAGGRITTASTSEGGHHAIVVRDTGDGIAPELLVRVFDRFWQADSAKTRRYGGLGLGLAIARHLLEAQGGTIVGTSEGLGHGAAFTLSLPAADAVPAPAPLADSGPPPSLAGIRILLVEDDEAMSEALAALLELHGATVTSAASVRTALGLLPAANPHLLLSDVGMPGESGYALIREIRTREASDGLHRLPALAMTGFASLEDRDEARAAGFDDHVPKPVEPEALLRRIGDLIGDSR